ncbi:MAG: L-threonine 3-dehydrogenase [Brevundimonas sp.]|uniref:L-threonine 3-dehydrogenase n=1 Tax=Brevundimonas sp. TaxID=1871086 RepID=UPI0030034212
MTDTMKALAKMKPAEGLELIDAPIPEAGPEDVLIKVHKTAVCGTDIHIWNWDEWSQKNVPVPMITGHEFSGEIVFVGKDVDRPLKIGQRVSAEGHVIDLNSEAARAGHFHLDPATRGIGVNRQGAFAEFVVAPAFNVIELPDDVPYAIGSILDPFGNAVHTAQQFDLLGEDVLVTGAGPIGIMAAAVARHAGARTVVLTDINDFRLDLAQKVAPGVRTVNTLKEDLHDVIAELGMKVGFDVALEMSGSPIAFKQCVDTLIMGGGLALLGIPSKPMETDWGAIILKALTIKGVYGREMFTTWRKMLGLLKAGLDLEPLITHQLNYADYREGFEVMKSGKSGKVVLDWSKAA